MKAKHFCVFYIKRKELCINYNSISSFYKIFPKNKSGVMVYPRPRPNLVTPGPGPGQNRKAGVTPAPAEILLLTPAPAKFLSRDPGPAPGQKAAPGRTLLVRAITCKITYLNLSLKTCTYLKIGLRFSQIKLKRQNMSW